MTPEKFIRKAYDFSSACRLNRLKDENKPENGVFSKLGRRRSSSLNSKPTAVPIPDPQEKPLSDSFNKRKPLKAVKEDSCEEVRSANAPLIYARPADLQLPNHVLARRCNSKERGSIYDYILGICCHFCRQKKLCGEEDCLRCGNRDVDQPCPGKTNCSICHSTQGVFCRACLKVRSGEAREMGYKSVAHFLMDELKRKRRLA